MTTVLLVPRFDATTPESDISCGAQWRMFENLLREIIPALGHQLVEWNGTGAEPVTDRRIYFHRCKRDGPGDLFYKQMHLCEAFTLDSAGWGADHSRSQSQPDLTGVDVQQSVRFCSEWAARALATGVSKHSQPACGGALELPEDFVL